MQEANRRFARLLTAAVLLGFAVRLAYIVFERRDADVMGDSFFYSFGATLLADGHGFIEPQPVINGIIEQSASHPPLYWVWLAIPSFFGLDTPMWHMLWSSLVGTSTVALLGLAGREVAGDRVGLIAAFTGAVYVNLWVFDGFILSETMSAFTVTLVLLLAYRYWRAPTLPKLAWLGAACGLAALARAELTLLVPLIVLPLVVTTKDLTRKVKLQWLVAGGLAAVLVVTPWVAYNLSRFEEPVTMSTGLEPTLLGAYCDVTFYGDLTGYFSPECVLDASKKPEPGADQSERNAVHREVALEYLGDHLTRLPAVVAVRWGRVTGLYRPRHQILLDTRIEGREQWVAETAWLSLYVVMALAITGAVALRKRRTAPLFPLLAPPIAVLIAVGMTLASNRYRASAEPALVILAALGIDAIWRAMSARRRPQDVTAAGD